MEKEPGKLPHPMLGVPPKHQTTQPQHSCRGPNASSVLATSVSVSPDEPCLVDSMGCVLMSSTPPIPIILPPLLPRFPQAPRQCTQ